MTVTYSGDTFGFQAGFNPVNSTERWAGVSCFNRRDSHPNHTEVWSSTTETPSGKFRLTDDIHNVLQVGQVNGSFQYIQVNAEDLRIG
jgi:hypothetical protein